MESEIFDVYPSESIQSAIDNASNGDIIIVHGNNGIAATYTENILVNKDLIIIVEGDGDVTVQAAVPTIPVISIDSSGNGLQSMDLSSKEQMESESM